MAVANPSGVPIFANSLFYEKCANQPNGSANGRVCASGQTWVNDGTNTAEFIDGYLTNSIESGAAASYSEIALPDNIIYMGCEYVLPAGSDNSGPALLGANDSITSPTFPDCWHINPTGTGINIATVTAGVFTPVTTLAYPTRAPLIRSEFETNKIDLVFSGINLYVAFNGAYVDQVSMGTSSNNAVYAIYECYQTDAAVDPKPKIANAWASDLVSSTYIGFVTLAAGFKW